METTMTGHIRVILGCCFGCIEGSSGQLQDHPNTSKTRDATGSCSDKVRLWACQHRGSKVAGLFLDTLDAMLGIEKGTIIFTTRSQAAKWYVRRGPP